MAIYVDPLVNWGWILRGRNVPNSHMFTDTLDLEELHQFALAIGMKRSWFQDSPRAPHYDLTPGRRSKAVSIGAIELDRREAAQIWRKRRQDLAAAGTIVLPAQQQLL